VLSCLGRGSLYAKTISRSPRPAFLLRKSDQFIAQAAWNSVALYSFGDTKPIRTFPAGSMIGELEPSPDEKLLLIACREEFGVYDIKTGDKLWWRTSLSGLYGASFSWNGNALVAYGEDFALVFDALTGKQMGGVTFPPRQTTIASACLSPDGAKGALVDLEQRLFIFETATGLIRETGVTGAWPVRYSADGKYIALRNGQLR
jgi:hypothetical protein